jgi:hypothetical protein
LLSHEIIHLYHFSYKFLWIDERLFGSIIIYARLCGDFVSQYYHVFLYMTTCIQHVYNNMYTTTCIQHVYMNTYTTKCIQHVVSQYIRFNLFLSDVVNVINSVARNDHIYNMMCILLEIFFIVSLYTRII